MVFPSILSSRLLRPSFTDSIYIQLNTNAFSIFCITLLSICFRAYFHVFVNATLTCVAFFSVFQFCDIVARNIWLEAKHFITQVHFPLHAGEENCLKQGLASTLHEVC